MTTSVNEFIDEQGWAVVDRLLAACFQEQVLIDGSPVEAGTSLRDRPYPAILVERLPGGGINVESYEDVSRIAITSYGRTKPESIALTAQIRTLMAGLSNDEYAGVGLDRIFEETGPGRIPDPNEDLHAVPTTWSVTARRQ